MNNYQNIKTSSNDFQTEASSCCFGKLQQIDYQYEFKTQNSIPFTGKELDSETGYSYFGARYYDAELSGLFFSVDPMADKYPNISPYTYCAWNPVKLVDPDGEYIDDYFSVTGKYLGSDNALTNNVRIISETTWYSLSKDITGKIDHYVGFVLSTSFSQKSREGMSVESQLEVYNHYNLTRKKLVNLENNGESWGMRTYIEKGRDPVVKIRLEGNSRESIAVCDYADEIINLFAHENGHISQYNELGFDKYCQLSKNEREQNAVRTQMRHFSWTATRQKFKEAFIEYGEEYGLKNN